MALYVTIGIDPGSRKTGWGIVGEESGQLKFMDCGVIIAPVKKELKENFSERLAFIYNALREIISSHQIQAAAIETVFTAKNVLSALKLGQARGVVVAACASAKLPIFDYEPNLIKKSLTGSGHAEKEQIAFMVGRLLNMKTDNLKLDTTDALAMAICHLSQRKLQTILKQSV